MSSIRSEVITAYAHTKTCNKCHVTKASERFEARGLVSRNQCKVCKSAIVKKRRCRARQTVDGWLRDLYNCCKNRHKNKKKYEGEMITFERFKAIYQAQGGVCVETGVPFDLQSKDLMPSPDHIDNAAGYVNGNVRFVTWRVRNMRKNMSTARFQSTCMEVVEPNESIIVTMPDGRLRFKGTYYDCTKRHKNEHEGAMITFECFNAIYQAQGGVCFERRSL